MTTKVLIVEDDRDYKNICVRPLQKHDVIIIWANTIEMARELFANNQDVSIIVLDACMPGDELNTLELLSEFRQSFFGPIIANSSKREYVEQMILNGCTHRAYKFDAGEVVIGLLPSTNIL